MATLTERFARRLTPPTPPSPEDYTPPELSATALRPPAALSAATNDSDDNNATPAGHGLLGQRAPLPTAWSESAWEHYDACGEARQSVDWIANGLSRFHLYIGQRKEDGAGDPEPVDNPGQAGDVLAELVANMGERAMLYRLAVHLLVPGESWLVGYPAPDKDGGDSDTTAWTVLSRTEWADGDGGRLRIKLANDPRAAADHWVTFDPDSTAVVPMYRPDPRDATYATSAFEAALSVLTELDGLDRRVSADIDSRLAGAGVFAIPESATMPNPNQGEGANPLHSDPFVNELTRAMSTAIQNPDSASAVTPIVVKVPDEVLAKLQHVTFTTPFDAQIPPLREGARERVAADLDVPKEVVTGISDMNHWASWKLDEDAVKSHMGPLAALICETLTKKVLEPALAETDQADQEYMIWWDASEVILRPDRSTEALAAHKQGLISDKAARRELGFSDEDAPEDPPEPEGNQDGEQQGQGEADTDQVGQPDEGGGQPNPSERPNPPRQQDAQNPDQQAAQAA